MILKIGMQYWRLKFTKFKDLVYSKVKFGNLGFSIGKSKKCGFF